MNRVFVLGSTKKPLMPCHPARARELLKKGKAAVYRMQPFTIILKYRSDGDTQPVEFKVDPGSRYTGLALIALFKRGRVLIWAANLTHRGIGIRNALLARRAIRRGRRQRNTRYRQPRFLNRTRGHNKVNPHVGIILPNIADEIRLPPSLMSRVDNILNWRKKLCSYAPITSTAVEHVRFDMQLLVRATIKGKQYQQGELYGYEQKEYLLEKWNRCCVYCGIIGVPLQKEHIRPKSKGGSDRISNLTLACQPCNQAKGNMPIEWFLANNPVLLKRILAYAKLPLSDASAVNSTRRVLARRLVALDQYTGLYSGGLTKYNRTLQGYPKDHFVDAACVGITGDSVYIKPGYKPLYIKAMGRGNRQVVRTDKYGFPCARAKSVKSVLNIRTGDLIKLSQPKGKYIGSYLARVSAINAKTAFLSISYNGKQTWFSAKLATILQRGDGYAYT